MLHIVRSFPSVPATPFAPHRMGLNSMDTHLQWIVRKFYTQIESPYNALSVAINAFQNMGSSVHLLVLEYELHKVLIY